MIRMVGVMGGGRAWVDNAVGRGSVVLVELIVRAGVIVVVCPIAVVVVVAMGAAALVGYIFPREPFALIVIAVEGHVSGCAV